MLPFVIFLRCIILVRKLAGNLNLGSFIVFEQSIRFRRIDNCFYFWFFSWVFFFEKFFGWKIQWILLELYRLSILGLFQINKNCVFYFLSWVFFVPLTGKYNVSVFSIISNNCLDHIFAFFREYYSRKGFRLEYNISCNYTWRFKGSECATYAFEL